MTATKTRPNRHVVVLPDGSRATRSSQSRIYPVAIALGPVPREAKLAQLRLVISRARSHVDLQQVRLDYLCAGGAVEFPEGDGARLTGLPREYALSWAFGRVFEGQWRREPGDNRANLTAAVAGLLRESQAEVARLTGLILKLEAGPALVGSWSIASWHMSLPLAERQAARYRANEGGREVRILNASLEP